MVWNLVKAENFLKFDRSSLLSRTTQNGFVSKFSSCSEVISFNGMNISTTNLIALLSGTLTEQVHYDISAQSYENQWQGIRSHC